MRFKVNAFWRLSTMGWGGRGGAFSCGIFIFGSQTMVCPAVSPSGPKRDTEVSGVVLFFDMVRTKSIMCQCSRGMHHVTFWDNDAANLKVISTCRTEKREHSFQLLMLALFGNSFQSLLIHNFIPRKVWKDSIDVFYQSIYLHTNSTIRTSAVLIKKYTPLEWIYAHASYRSTSL